MSPPRSVARLVDLYWLWVFLATLIIMGYRIGRPELWRDELSSWSAATRPLDELFAMVQNIDASSAAYYVLLHFWIALFGDSVVAMRVPSAVAMAAAAAVVAHIARLLYRRSSGSWPVSCSLSSLP